MNPTKFLPYVAVLLVGGLIGFIISNANKSDKNSQLTEVTQPQSTDIATTPETTPADDSTSLKQDTLPAEQPATNDIISVALPTDNTCFADNQSLSLQLSLFAEGIERDSVMYDNKNSAKLADCSGMFLRVTKFVASKCNQYEYPQPNEARGTSQLISWYHNKKNLILIKNNEDAFAKRNLIKPGAIMFFGRSGQVYNNVDIGIAQSQVMHVGTVTEVNKDDQGNVIGYTMFHGRSAGKIAQRTFYHGLKPPRLGYPVLGNWNQQWIGISYIMTPKST